MAKRSTDSREAFKVRHNVFDEFTNKLLYKLIKQGYFEGLESPVSIGKESNVFTALTAEKRRVIVKIYRLESCDFTKMYDYIKGDPRIDRLPRKRRDVIFSWTQREFRNLMKAREANVPVPVPLTFQNHILVEEWIGIGEETCSQLKDDIPENLQGFFDEIVKNMKKLYKAGFVHADLSPFNILNRDGKPIFIDFSQTTSREHPQAEEFLERDLKNVSIFFKKKGLEIDQEAVLKEIRGNNL